MIKDMQYLVDYLLDIWRISCEFSRPWFLWFRNRPCPYRVWKFSHL